MYKSKYLIFGKRSIIIFSIIISLLFISSVTAVPQSNGSLTIDKIDDLKQNQKILELIENFKKINHKSITNNDLYLFTKIIEFETLTIVSKYNDEKSINSISVQKENNSVKNEVIIRETKNCITSLSSSIEIIKNDYKSNSIEFDSLNILGKYLLKIDNAFTNNFYNNNDINKDEYLQLNNGVFQNIISLLLTIIQFILTLLKALLQGFFTVFGGLIKTIGALIGIIILIIADIQTILLLTGLYIISLGILSRNIIKTLAGIGAPIFAAISAFLSIAIGSLLGSIVTIGFSIIGIAIILAIPIALIAGFLYFSGYFDDGDGDGDGLLYIITSSLAYYLKSI